MERFADYLLVRRLDAGGIVEHYEAQPASGAGERRLLVRVSHTDRRWMPWADPALATILRHPNIVTLHHSAAFATPPYFVYELVPGLDLRELMAREHLPVDVACYIAREVCVGLAAALESRARDGSALRWVHGQIGPRQVHLYLEGDVKLSGFGVGRLKPESTASLDGPVDERALYMAPESASGADYGSQAPSVDVFAVGAVLHAMISRGPLLAPTTTFDYLLALVAKDVMTFSQIRDGGSPELVELLAAMLARQPHARPRDAAELVARFDALPELRDPAALRQQLTDAVARAACVS